MAPNSSVLLHPKNLGETMPRNRTGYPEIDDDWRLRWVPAGIRQRLTGTVANCVRAEYESSGIVHATLDSETLRQRLTPGVRSRVRDEVGFPWLTIALLIARILIEIWIRRHAIETCLNRN